MMLSLSTATLLVSSLTSTAIAQYTLSQDYTGSKFYDGFDFFTDKDPTNGHVDFVDRTDANNSGIAGMVTGGSAKNAVYLGMDTVNEAPEGRRSVRVQSTKAFNRGLIIADIAHMPGGVCSTWPAFWMVGPDWPHGGEIDIIEGVSNQTANKMTLHTGPGAAVSSLSSKAYSGDLVTPNCDVAAPDQHKNAGCTIADTDETTFGKGFNDNGGGVFATEWTSAAIKIWFFPRSGGTPIPADLLPGATPDPSNPAWGTPRAEFSGSTLKVDNHFQDLNIIFDTTFCGDWAGAVWADSGCGALAPTCEEYVAMNPKAFEDMYWAVNSLQVFEDPKQQSSAQSKIKSQSKTRLQARPLQAKRAGGAVLPIPTTST